MCFAPQRGALFRHLNFQKRSGPDVFCTFWLGNVLRATTACTFSTSQLPKAVRSWGALHILTWKCASRHNGVQLFISHLASRLRTRRFSEPTFRPSGATNHWKNTVFRDFPTFSRICIFFLLTLSLLLFFLLIFLFSLPLPCSAFHLSILSEVWLLNFLRTILGILRCVRIWQKAKWWYIITIITYHAETCIHLFCAQLPFWNYSVKNSTKDMVSNQFSCFRQHLFFCKKCDLILSQTKHIENTFKTQPQHIRNTCANALIIKSWLVGLPRYIETYSKHTLRSKHI